MTWQTTPFLLLALVIVGGFAWYERRRPPARVVALVAAMAALAVVGRLAFAAIPNVKPTTDIVLFAGYALGPVPGFVVGAVTALVSNVFLGHGPWTAWQMVAWGGVGVGGALLARVARGREIGRWRLAGACAAASLAFGAVMDVYQTSLAARQDLDTYLAISATSLPYNAAHVIGSVVFCLLIGPVFIRALARYRRRFEVRWASPGRSLARPGAAALGLVVAVAVAVALAPTDASASPSSEALRYLERAQNADGGFGDEPGEESSELFTGWAALGVAAAGRNPRQVARGRSAIDYVRTTGSVGDTGELERTILVLSASGLSPRRFRGRDLVADLKERRRADGSWQGNVAFTAFGVLALRAAGEPPTPLGASVRWLRGAQNSDGGFGVVADAPSDVDDTGAALQAFAAAGGSTAAQRRGVAYLRRMRNPDGGFGQSRGRSSNAQSTAWAVQGLLASGARTGPAPLNYLIGLQRSDGHIAYSRTSDQTPVWVTAQALTALAKRPFPIAPVALERRVREPRGGGDESVAGEPEKGASKESSGRRRSKGGKRERGSRGRGAGAGGEPRPFTGLDALESDPAADKGAPREARAEGGGPSALLLAGVSVGALALLLLARRGLRRARDA